MIKFKLLAISGSGGISVYRHLLSRDFDVVRDVPQPHCSRSSKPSLDDLRLVRRAETRPQTCATTRPRAKRTRGKRMNQKRRLSGRFHLSIAEPIRCGFRRCSLVPIAAVKPKLTYRGGPLITSVEVLAMFWALGGDRHRPTNPYRRSHNS